MWMVPLVVTLAVFLLVIVTNQDGGIVGAAFMLLKLGGAIIVSLVAWLLWALVNM